MAGLRESIRLLAAGLLMAMAISGHADGSGSVPAAQAENAVRTPRTGRVPPPSGQAESSLKLVLAAVRADAAAALGVPVAGVRAQVEEMVWSDGSLGCGAPGMTATQALEPGWRITVTVSSPAMKATYHTSKRGHWKLCAAMAGAGPAER